MYINNIIKYDIDFKLKLYMLKVIIEHLKACKLPYYKQIN